MNWDEQINGISIGTLFKFCGKWLVASILWVFAFYIILMVPMFIIMAIVGFSVD